MKKNACVFAETNSEKATKRIQQARAAKLVGGYYNNAFAIFHLYQWLTFF